jgi:hypothetical protein
MKTFLESFYDIQELTPHTKFSDAKGMEYLKVYRSSARPNKHDYTEGSHAGTLQQALIRADYMINDEEKYDEYYLYELIIRLGRIYPSLLKDDGSNHGYDYISDMKDYDTAFYKNTGEGDIRNENLSIIIINPDSITSSKMSSVLTKEYLLSKQNMLY